MPFFYTVFRLNMFLFIKVYDCIFFSLHVICKIMMVKVFHDSDLYLFLQEYNPLTYMEVILGVANFLYI